MAVPLVALTAAPLDAAALMREIGSAGAGGYGAVTSFVGLVRDSNVGRRVLFLDYEAYEPMAERVLQRIVDEAEQMWPNARVGVHHRTGRMEIGEASVI